MRIKCGKCQDYHDSIAEVRACQNVMAPSKDAPWRGEPATDSQRNKIAGLFDRSPVAGKDEHEAWLIARAEDAMSGKDLSKGEASDVITYLLDLPEQKETRDNVGWPDEDEATVPAGRYALESPSDSHIVFYQVDVPGKESKWFGRTFVNVLTGAPGDFRRIAMRGSQGAEVLRRIAANPVEASTRFGKEVGQCGVCHSPLTNEASRAAGIGPVCARKMGW